MKDEIKEILDYYQKDIDRYEKNMKNYTEYQQKTTFSKNYQRYKNHKILLDYITNLQEENEKLNMQNDLMEQNIEDLQDIRDKAIEYIKDDMYVEPKELYGLVDGQAVLNILQGKE